MIEERTGDIFEERDLNCIAHQANCFCTMGSGIAKIIRERFPEAYQADLKTKKGDSEKLGTYSYAMISRDVQNENDEPWLKIANVYGQFGFGGRSQTPPVRDTLYDSLYDGLELLRDDTEDLICKGDLNASEGYRIGIPYGLGSALGGGKWRIVREMIYDIYSPSDLVTARICRLPNTPDL
jgi:hypothetical protein